MQDMSHRFTAFVLQAQMHLETESFDFKLLKIRTVLSSIFLRDTLYPNKLCSNLIMISLQSGGLGKNDIAAVLTAMKAMAALGVDPKSFAQIINIMKTIAENGVPSVEIARVLQDGVMPKELTDVLIPNVLEACGKDLAPPDVDAFVNLYDNLRLKSNIPLEVIEHVDNTLIQVSKHGLAYHVHHSQQPLINYRSDALWKMWQTTWFVDSWPVARGTHKFCAHSVTLC